MRTTCEVRAELDAVNDEIEATRDAFSRGLLDRALTLAYYLEPLDERRMRLEAELVEIREAERATPDLFDLGPALATAEAMDRIMAQGFPPLFGRES